MNDSVNIFSVTGMTCEGCAQTIKTKLELELEISKADISFSSTKLIIHSSKSNNIAHRGGMGLGPENTMITFQKAIEVGADINHDREKLITIFNQIGFVFLFAPLHHQAMKHVMH